MLSRAPSLVISGHAFMPRWARCSGRVLDSQKPTRIPHSWSRLVERILLGEILRDAGAVGQASEQEDSANQGPCAPDPGQAMSDEGQDGVRKYVVQ